MDFGSKVNEDEKALPATICMYEINALEYFR